MEISKQQAKLFLALLRGVQGLSVENNILMQRFNNIEVGLIDTYMLMKNLEEFVGE